MSRNSFALPAALALLISFALAAPVALADPPSHAPAHGWRKKHDPYYVGYTGHRWNDDYGIRDGRCDRDRVRTVLGASADDRLIAILGSKTIGAVIGREMGREMDENDRACFGHSLELLEDGRRVDWDGTRAGMRYTLTPDRRFERDGRVCRRFALIRNADGADVTKQGSACRYGDGDWRMVKD
jgi:surface antigen